MNWDVVTPIQTSFKCANKPHMNQISANMSKQTDLIPCLFKLYIAKNEMIVHFDDKITHAYQYICGANDLRGAFPSPPP